MKPQSSLHFSLADLLALACAVVILAAFFLMPWYQLDQGGTVTGRRLAADTGDDLDLPVRISHMFILVIPIAAGAAGIAAAAGLVKRQPSSHLITLILLAGLIVIGYYYAAFFYESYEEDLDALQYVKDGFYVVLAAALGLIVQFALPRPAGRLKISVTKLERPPAITVQNWWGWPWAAIRILLGWLRAGIGWVYVQLTRLMRGTPLLAYLIGLWAAADLEYREGPTFAKLLGFRKELSLFGVSDVLKPFSDLDFSGILAPFFPAPSDKYPHPLNSSWDAIHQLAKDFISAFSSHGARNPGFFKQLFDVLQYDIAIFVIPILVIALLFRHPTNRLLLWLKKPTLPQFLTKSGADTQKRARLPGMVTGLLSPVALLLQIVMLYLAISRWTDLSDYRELIVVYMCVNIMLSVSLNLVNGYMGEFSVGHAGFMAVGAYVSAVLTMWAFTNSKEFGSAALTSHPALLFHAIGFLIALMAGGAAAALAGLLVAFPSFKTRGDYLAIITLAVNFIVTGVINNMEFIGGPRGLNGVPIWTNLPWVFVMTVLSVLAIYNLVNSTFGKGIIAIREDEIASELMGVNTRRVKVVAFLVSSFIAGVSGGLMVHVLAYANPGMFGILKSTEALVMVYLGGMGSITGSIVAAVLFTLLIEAFRPLEVLKWVVIPLILIFLMLHRPQGLFGFREINLNLGGNQEAPREEVNDGPAGD